MVQRYGYWWTKCSILLADCTLKCSDYLRRWILFYPMYHLEICRLGSWFECFNILVYIEALNILSVLTRVLNSCTFVYTIVSLNQNRERVHRVSYSSLVLLCSPSMTMNSSTSLPTTMTTSLTPCSRN